MNARDALFQMEFQALLERCKAIPPVPSNIRMRSVVRARTAAANVTTLPVDAAPVGGRRGVITAVAASIAFLIGAGVASAGFYARSHYERRAVPAERPERKVEPSALTSAATPEADLPEATMPPKAPHAGRMTITQESYAAELRLLQRAQAAYASSHFADALALAAEHRRRFPRGRLTEEREALRVRALSRAGRTDEADRAAKAFAERFPRSVLLPRLGVDRK